MLYTTITVNDKEYKLRLNAKASIDLERKLGKNPLSVIMELSENNLPSIETLVLILHESLQAYQHGITLDATYNIYDEMVDEGKALEDIIPVIVDIFRVSGYFKESDSKN